jgi:hypothetical protein
LLNLVSACADSILRVQAKAFTGSELTPEDRRLRNDMFASFDDWNSSLLDRIKEALKSTEDKVEGPANGKRAVGQAKFGSFAIPETGLSTLQFDLRKAILSSILLLSLSLETHNYDPRSRTMLHILSLSLQLPSSLLLELEKDVAKILVSAAMKADEEENKKRNEAASYSRKWKMGIVGVAGGLLVGITGFVSKLRG